jgi:predicted AAA+ superfamily ATPase
MIIDEFGFDSKEEFIKEAVAEKILELKKQIFSNVTDQVGAALRSEGIITKQMLKEFEEVRE